jgi:hypothetical protein
VLPSVNYYTGLTLYNKRKLTKATTKKSLRT